MLAGGSNRPQGYDAAVDELVSLFVVTGFVLGACLWVWLGVSAVRRRGFAGAMRAAKRQIAYELPRNLLVVAAAWTFVVAAPVIAAWTIVTGDFDLVGFLLVAALWLMYLGLLRWRRRSVQPASREPSWTRSRHDEDDVDA
jgi:hypothetical protein